METAGDGSAFTDRQVQPPRHVHEETDSARDLSNSESDKFHTQKKTLFFKASSNVSCAFLTLLVLIWGWGVARDFTFFLALGIRMVVRVCKQVSVGLTPS